MNKAKFMSMVLAGVMVITSALPVVAADNNSCTVTYSQTASYSVNIPQKVELGTDKTGTYKVKVTGEIGNKQTVTVTPNASFTMTSAEGGSVTATVTQDNTWTSDQVKSGTEKQGTITAKDLTVGDWTGTLQFTISLNTNSN